MSDLKDLLQGAAELKREAFATEDFADGYGRSVIGRVKRRRAVSATAMGGGTVVAVGAIAVGASNVPWNGLAFGGPASSPSVVCTTSTPDAVAGSGVIVPEGATFVLVDNASNEYVFLGADGGSGLAWSSAGAPIPLEAVPGSEGSERLTLASGHSVVFRAQEGTGWVLPRRDSIVTALTLDEFVGELDDAGSVFSDDGTFLGGAIHTPSGSLALIADGKLYPLSDANGLNRSFVDETGQVAIVTLVDDKPAGLGSEPTATPVVTCVTTTPEASPSASPAPSASASASSSTPEGQSPSPSATPNPPALVGSPFQCGYALPSEERSTPDVWITVGEPTTPGEFLDAVSATYGEDNERQFDMSGDAVPVATVNYAEELVRSGGGGSTGDPETQDVGSSESEAFVLGAQFVLVSEGQVIATATTSADSLPAMHLSTAEGPESMPLYLLNRSSALEACDGVADENLEAADLYAVAGIKVLSEDAPYGPVYAWSRVTE